LNSVVVIAAKVVKNWYLAQTGRIIFIGFKPENTIVARGKG
jgi:hypothetical protein